MSTLGSSPFVRCLAFSTFFLLMASTAWANRYSALIIDASTGQVLLDRYSREPRYPASLTKMMTLYMVFEALQRGTLRLNQPLRVSSNASRKPPSKLGLKAGQTITVEQAIFGLVTRSANDAATVIAENLAGTESRFGQQMTSRARSLGMSQSYFRNASGLPDPGQVTTAWDMATLARALIRDHPRYYRYFSTDQFYFRNKTYRNHNHLLETYAGADGIKTGYIRASGYNLVASAQRNGRRIVGVVFGGNTARQRDTHMAALLDYGFMQLGGSGGRYMLANAAYQPAPEISDESQPVSSSITSGSRGYTVLRPRTSVSSTAPLDTSGNPRYAVDRTAYQTTSRTTTAAIGWGGKTSAVELIGRPEPTPDLASANDPLTADSSGFWQVQVGVFSRLASAREHLIFVARSSPDVLFNAKSTIIPLLRGGAVLYRALFQGFSQEQAGNICDALKRKRIDCLTAPQTS